MTQKEKFMLLKQIMKERAELQRVLKANRKTVNFKGQRTEIEFDMTLRNVDDKVEYKKVKLGSLYASKYVNPFNYYCNCEYIDGKLWYLTEPRIPGFAGQQFPSTTHIISDLNFLYRVLRNERKTVKKSQELIDDWNKNYQGSYLKKAYDWIKEE
jgi:hypothetical protein